MHSTIHPFLYEDLLRQILDDDNASRLLLHAGRGLGKSTLLRRLQREKLGISSRVAVPPDEDEDKRVYWVDGRSTAGRQRLLDWCKRPRGIILVDDFDHLFDVEIDKALLSITDRNESHYRMVVASRKPPPVLDAKVIDQKNKAGVLLPWDDSRALPTFTFRRLNPWADGWRAVLKSQHFAAVERLVGLLGEMISSGDKAPCIPIRADILLWDVIVADVSGGYPCLVDGAFDLLVALVMNGLVRDGLLEAEVARKHPLRQRSRWDQTITLEDLRRGGAAESVRALIEDFLMARSMVHLKATMTELQASEPPAFQKLTELATSGKEALVEDANVRALLLDSGLASQNPLTRMLLVPEGLVRATLVRLSGGELPPAPAPAAPIEVTGIGIKEGASEQAGVVVVSTTTGPLEVSLNGRPWEVFSYFWERRDRFVPHDELVAPLGMPSEGAVRNVIARLKEMFKAVGVEEIFENQKGVGYRVMKG